MQAIIFDFGNVVGFFDHGLTLKRMAPHTKMAREEMFDAVYAGELEDDFESARISEAEFLARVADLWHVRCDHATLAAAIADIFTPNPEICGLIAKLKGRYRLLLGSNTNVIHSLQFRKQFAQTLSLLDHLVLSHDIGVRKPRAGFFEHCVKQAGCDADQCLFVDDIAANVDGARACGLNAILYKPDGSILGALKALGVQP